MAAARDEQQSSAAENFSQPANDRRRTRTKTRRKKEANKQTQAMISGRRSLDTRRHVNLIWPPNGLPPLFLCVCVCLLWRSSLGVGRGRRPTRAARSFESLSALARLADLIGRSISSLPPTRACGSCEELQASSSKVGAGTIYLTARRPAARRASCKLLWWPLGRPKLFPASLPVRRRQERRHKESVGA